MKTLIEARQAGGTVSPESINLALAHSLPVSVKSWTRHMDVMEATGMPVYPEPDMPTRSEITTARSLMDEACRSAEVKDLARLLMRLRIAVSAQKLSQDEAKMQTQVYLEELSNWPADVALYVLQTQPKVHDWFPPLEKLCERLHAHGGRRLQKLAQVRALEGRLSEAAA